MRDRHASAMQRYLHITKKNACLTLYHATDILLTECTGVWWEVYPQARERLSQQKRGTTYHVQATICIPLNFIYCCDISSCLPLTRKGGSGYCLCKALNSDRNSVHSSFINVHKVTKTSIVIGNGRECKRIKRKYMEVN